MSTLQNINIGRLLLAIAITVLIADTTPTPSLSAGLWDSAWGRLATNLISGQGAATAHTALAQLAAND
ncbi:hypothetical protein [Halomicronema sp. CCY15110]|uniref:hypothetical protein n=1 Tax=Halomicronema sp. CCY15110 TaxID=2767773 RepID=UPI00194EFA95|nr:hypothetical protein [Halomicronema sp. CCY15110]